jgi:hypothetical protein
MPAADLFRERFCPGSTLYTGLAATSGRRRVAGKTAADAFDPRTILELDRVAADERTGRRQVGNVSSHPCEWHLEGLRDLGVEARALGLKEVQDV